MTSPIFHFPRPKDPLVGDRNVFEEYGSLTGIYTITKEAGVDECVTQKIRYSPKVLCAQGPPLPMRSPDIGYSKEEPCMGALKSIHEKKLRFVKKIYGMRRDSIKLDGDKIHIDVGKNSTSYTTFDYLATLVDQHREQPYTPPVNYAFNGGCLSQINTSFGQLVCHPTGKNLKVPSLSKLGDTAAETTLVSSESALKRRIHQIETEEVCNLYYGAVRTRKGACSTYRLRESPEGQPVLSMVEELPTDDIPTSINLSPYIEGESVTASEAGKAHLWSGASCVTSVRTEPRFTCPVKWTSAHFGSHPRQIVITDQTGMAIWDVRARQRSDDLFVLPSTLLRNSDRIMVSRSHPSKQFYHVLATAETLMMVDERFPIRPVLLWRHSLPHPPQYLSIVSEVLEKDDIILLASQEKPEAHCFQINMSDPTKPPLSTSAPWRIAGPKDMYLLYENSTLDVSNIPLSLMERLGTPLIGVTAGRNVDGDGMSIIQMTSHGDMFHQRYAGGSEEMEKTWSSGPGSSQLKFSREDKSHLRQWLSKLNQLSSTTNELSQSEETPDAHSLFKGKDFVSANANGIFCEVIPPVSSATQCKFCPGYLQNIGRKNHESSDVCPSCHVNFNQMNGFLSDFKEVTFTCLGPDEEDTVLYRKVLKEKIDALNIDISSLGENHRTALVEDDKDTKTDEFRISPRLTRKNITGSCTPRSSPSVLSIGSRTIPTPSSSQFTSISGRPPLCKDVGVNESGASRYNLTPQVSREDSPLLGTLEKESEKEGTPQGANVLLATPKSDRKQTRKMLHFTQDKAEVYEGGGKSDSTLGNTNNPQTFPAFNSDPFLTPGKRKRPLEADSPTDYTDSIIKQSTSITHIPKTPKSAKKNRQSLMGFY